MIQGYLRQKPRRVWLDICEEPGDLVAEGSIHGSEELMRKVKKATRAILEPDAGPSLALKCEGDRNGVRWVKALRTRRH